MTVCIAVITENKDIIGVADKKLTVSSGVTSVYEINENEKIVQLTDVCAAMFAGNIANANEVLKKVKPKIKQTDSVEVIAKKIISVCTECYNFTVESVLLGQYGLTLKTFNEQQKTLDATFVGSTIQTIQQNSLGIEILVIGKDNGEPQIIKIADRNAMSDETSIGYASIGSGGSHAHLSLIESEAHPNMAFDSALHAIVKAKRKAEYDPNVGEKSDIVIINDKVRFVEDSQVKGIYQEYDKSLDDIKSISDNTSKKIGRIINGTTPKQSK